MAKIDTAAIEGYDAMTAEEKVAALMEYDFPNEGEKLRQAVTKANREAAEWRRKYEAVQETGGRQSTQELEQLRQQVADLTRDKTVAGFTSRLIAQGYEEALAAATAEAMADGDTETVLANQQTFLTGYTKALKAEGLRRTPRPPAGGRTEALTREDIMKIRDSGERQAAIAQNMELFQKG